MKQKKMAFAKLLILSLKLPNSFPKILPFYDT